MTPSFRPLLIFNPLWLDCVILLLLIYWDGNKMAAILQTSFSNAFSWTIIAVFWSQLYWNMFPGSQLIKPTLIQMMPRRWNNDTLVYWQIYASLGHNAWVPARCQNISWAKVDLIKVFFSIKWVQTDKFYVVNIPGSIPCMYSQRQCPQPKVVALLVATGWR